jgi:mannitol/fructose-specific phosphotransferase system IIA component (Ntr-type)
MKIAQFEIPNADVYVVWEISNEDIGSFRRMFPVNSPQPEMFNNPDLFAILSWCLQRSWRLDSRDALRCLNSLAKREGLGATASGGFARPHTRMYLDFLRVRIIWLEFVEANLDLNAIDGEPCNTIVLQLSPPDQNGSHLRALEFTSRIRIQHGRITERIFEDRVNFEELGSDEVENLLHTDERLGLI